eukprot:jgi/Astpho2/9803/Aster-03774
MAARHESDTTDLYCIFDPDTAHRLAGWGWDWKENHRLGQADFKVFVQNASLRIQSYGDQWLRTIRPAASHLLQTAVPLSSVQPPASANPMPSVPPASKASYGVTLLPQALSALRPGNERDSFLVEKQVWKLSGFQTVAEAF